MLSRHFYEINEVCMALIQSLRKGHIDESVFWGREIIMSCESDLLQKTVIQAWILWLGSRNIHWLDLWAKCDDDVEKMVLLAEFCVLRSKMTKKDKRSCTYPFIMCARGTALELQEDAVLDATNPFSLYYNLGKDYIASPTAAVEYISGLVESIIEPVLTMMKYVKPMKLKILLIGCAAQVSCLKIYPADICITKADYVNELLVKWDTLVNRRKGRLFAITEKDMIHGKKRITQDVGLFIGHQQIFQNGSTFWKQYIDCDDDELINSLFPDDIPDEWSYEDRSLSHPIKFKKYIIYYKPEYKFRQIWGFVPFLKRSWLTELDGLFGACSCPSI